MNERVSMAVLPDCIDKSLKAFEGASFQLGAGTHWTRGAWDYKLPGREWVMASGNASVVGRSAGETVLVNDNPESLVNGVAATYQHLLTAGSRTGAASGVTIANLTLSPLATHPTKALQVWGREVTIENVRVQNVWGARGVLEGEGFGILVNNSPGNMVDGSVKVRNCEVDVVPGAYACAFYVGTPYETGRTLETSTLFLCRAVCKSGASNRAHCGFGIQSNQVLDSCSADGFERAIFSDTGAGECVTIRKFVATGCAIGFELRASRPEWHRRLIAVEDSTFVFGQGRGGYVAAVVLADDTPDGQERPVMEDIEFTGCVFLNASPDPGHVGSSNGPAFKPVVFSDCCFVGKWDDSQARKAGWKFDACRFIE